VKGKRVIPHSPPLGILSPVRRRVSVERALPIGIVLEGARVLLPPALGIFAFRYFQNRTWTAAANDVETSASAQLFLLLALAACFLCDSACSSALAAFTDRLIAPLRHKLRKGRPTSSVNSLCRIRSIRQWLCSPSRCDRHCRPFRSLCISHNPPPIPSLSTNGCI
jgi:hypothetical protein